MALNRIQEFKTAPSIVDKLLSTGLEKMFSNGEIVVNENVFINTIPIVKKGCVKVMQTEDDGREILLYYIKPGDFCIIGFLGGLNDQVFKTKAIAEGETEVLFVPVTTAKRLTENIQNGWIIFSEFIKNTTLIYSKLSIRLLSKKWMKES